MIEWKPIPGWEEYEISSADAAVRKVSTGKELTPYANANGTVQVRLAKSRYQRSWCSVIALHKLAFPELHVKATKPVPMPEPMEGEEFREYGRYLVSNMGRVWSTHQRRYVHRITAPDRRQVLVDRAVAEVFGYKIPCEPGEEWKESHKYPGLSFSSLGRVYSYWFRSLITPSIDGKYIKVNYRGKKYRLHRILAELFIPNPYDHPEVDHINEDRYDNRVANLRWCTKEQNLQYYAENHYK
jgi:hypothetical protein